MTNILTFFSTRTLLQIIFALSSAGGDEGVEPRSAVRREGYG